MEKSRLQYLFDRYSNEKCPSDEEKELMELLAKSTNEQEVKKLLEKFVDNVEPEIEMPEQVAALILDNIFQKEKDPRIQIKYKKVHFGFRMRAAAAAVVFFAIATFWFIDKKQANNQGAEVMTIAENQQSILPEREPAVFTLALSNAGSVLRTEQVEIMRCLQYPIEKK